MHNYTRPIQTRQTFSIPGKEVNFLYSLFLIFFKSCLVPLCTRGPPGFISFLQPTQLTDKSHQCTCLGSLLSMPSSTSYCHCLHLGTHHFLDGQFLLLPFSNLAPHQPSTTNIIHPPQNWLYQCSVRILQGPSLLRAGKLWPMGKIWPMICFYTNKSHVQTQLFHTWKKP